MELIWKTTDKEDQSSCRKTYEIKCKPFVKIRKHLKNSKNKSYYQKGAKALLKSVFSSLQNWMKNYGHDSKKRFWLEPNPHFFTFIVKTNSQIMERKIWTDRKNEFKFPHVKKFWSSENLQISDSFTANFTIKTIYTLYHLPVNSRAHQRWNATSIQSSNALRFHHLHERLGHRYLLETLLCLHFCFNRIQRVPNSDAR